MFYNKIMLPKQNRKKTRSAFNATYKVKNSVHKSGITLFAGKEKNNVDELTKVGFVVSKKTHKRAVKRNRLKRLMRESYRLLQKENLLYSSQQRLSLIFVGFEKALNNDFQTTKSIIENLLKKIND